MLQYRESSLLDQLNLDTEQEIVYWIAKTNKNGSAILAEMSHLLKINFDIQYTEELREVDNETKTYAAHE